MATGGRRPLVQHWGPHIRPAVAGPQPEGVRVPRDLPHDGGRCERATLCGHLHAGPESAVTRVF